MVVVYNLARDILQFTKDITVWQKKAEDASPRLSAAFSWSTAALRTLEIYMNT
jgi:hypothetical protein